MKSFATIFLTVMLAMPVSGYAQDSGAIVLRDVQTKMGQCRNEFSVSSKHAECARICFQSFQRLRTLSGAAMDGPWTACVNAYTDAMRAGILAGSQSGPTPSPAAASPAPTIAAAAPPAQAVTSGTVTTPQEAIARLTSMHDQCVAMSDYKNRLERMTCINRCKEQRDQIEYFNNLGNTVLTADNIRQRMQRCSNEFDKALTNDQRFEQERNANEQQSSQQIAAVPDVPTPDWLQTRAARLKEMCDSGSPQYYGFDCDCIMSEFPKSWDRLRREQLDQFYRVELPAHRDRMAEAVARNLPQSYIDQQNALMAARERNYIAGNDIRPPVPQSCRK